MPIARLALTDFRNHAAATLVPGPGFVLLSGANGAGKTNILEAVSLLPPGRGLRGVALGEMARSDGTGGFGGPRRGSSRAIRDDRGRRRHRGASSPTAPERRAGADQRRRRAGQPHWPNGCRCCG